MIARTRTARGRAQSGLFSIEGTRLLERALRAGVALEAVVVAQGYAKEGEAQRRVLAAVERARIAAFFLPDSTMQQLTAGRGLGPVVALARRPAATSLPALLERSGAPSPLLLVACDVVDPGNVGALARTALAAGAAGLVLTGPADVYHPRALQTSRGSPFRLPAVNLPAGTNVVEALAGQGLYTVATAVAGGVALTEVVLPATPLAIVVGNEAHGLPEAVLSGADVVVGIPMHSPVDSYSVNAAAAIALYEANRQRSQIP